jgi:riboflavin synthase
MFTGIVETTATVLKKTDSGLTLERPSTFDDLKAGASIALNGACLSVVEFDDQSMSFFVLPETWNKTNLGDLEVGSPVNVERAMGAGGRFEGHIVQGHIEGTGTVTIFEKPSDSPWATLAIQLPDTISPFVVYKGSIAINGVSLTVVSIEKNICTIALIPQTLEITNLGTLKIGERVNIETDVLARYIESILAKRSA